MKRFVRLAMASVAVSAFSCISPIVHAAPNRVVIGDIDDMSGLYADVIGQVASKPPRWPLTISAAPYSE